MINKNFDWIGFWQDELIKCEKRMKIAEEMRMKANKEIDLLNKQINEYKTRIYNEVTKG